MSASFGLVHGSWHSPGAWDLLVPELEARGSRAIAVDLPASDPDAGLDAYADAILGALADEEDVVLVGHSLGGVSAAVAAARRPVRHVVYLCALLPKPGSRPAGRAPTRARWTRSRTASGRTSSAAATAASIPPGRGARRGSGSGSRPSSSRAPTRRCCRGRQSSPTCCAVSPRPKGAACRWSAWSCSRGA